MTVWFALRWVLFETILGSKSAQVVQYSPDLGSFPSQSFPTRDTRVDSFWWVLIDVDDVVLLEGLLVCSLQGRHKIHHVCIVSFSWLFQHLAKSAPLGSCW